MRDNVVFILAVLVLLSLFSGEPDLVDAMIEFLRSQK